ncbi:MAG: hypothetical protein LH471_05675 [Salinibacterium sp.]|nr:hypothetical protein [Salinibacterium sp.]
MTARLAAALSGLEPLTGADLLLVCKPTTSEPQEHFRFVNGIPEPVLPAPGGERVHGPVAVLEGEIDALERLLRGTSTIVDERPYLTSASSDIGAIMILAGIINSPLRRRPA